MSNRLIIVESPAKAKSLTRYLGHEYKALASYGHVRDLLPKTGAVDPDNNFAMHYEIVERNKKHVERIMREMKKADSLYLATDPDREGEAISWHLLELLKEKGVIGDKPVYRVEFFEMTKTAILNAVANPRQISANLIDAQQARRALDYLVGFNLSPLLWKKVRGGLSAGRVQSPALRMICEREAEINKFVTCEFWTVEANLETKGQSFVGKLTHFDGEKLAQFSISDESAAKSVHRSLTEAADGKLTVVEISKKQRKRNPAAPFTTSTLQQEASRKLRFSTRKTMQIAQQLYEGIDIDDGTTGLISYMRTDSVALASEAIQEIRRVITNIYGADSIPEQPRYFRNKSKNAQEAHEAIRPTSSLKTPDQLRNRLSSDQFKLYQLIWKRTIACQMTYAVIDTIAVDMSAGTSGIFRSSGSTIRNPGFMSIYLEGRDDKPEQDTKEVFLPKMEKGMTVDLIDIQPKQHFTEPPPRYNEASLVQTLEAYGIGRPSTYASIISTLLNREYVILEKRRFEPTEIGNIVNRFLSDHFKRYTDYDFTAKMEDALDAISRGEKQRVPLMREFWKHFSKQVENKEESVSREDAIQSRLLGTDPASGKPVSVRMGRYGSFAQIGTREDEEKPRFASLHSDQKLDLITFSEALELFNLPRSLGHTPDGEDLVVNSGRYGPYAKYGGKTVSLGDNNPYTVDRETVLRLVAEKKQIDANKLILDFSDHGIQVLNGRYGPYVSNGKKNARLPTKYVEDPETLSLEQCQQLLSSAKPARKKKKRSKAG